MATPKTTIMRPQVMPLLHVVKESSAGRERRPGSSTDTSVARTTRKMTRELGGRSVRVGVGQKEADRVQVPAVESLREARRWAKSNGRGVYQVEFKKIASPYIGETEKNLRAAFAEAEKMNAVLLLDEADALFGKRSEVKDAHDRYANIDVNYLLSQIEAHNGVVLLSSNLRDNVDEAFIRRLRYVSVARTKPVPPRPGKSVKKIRVRTSPGA